MSKEDELLAKLDEIISVLNAICDSIPPAVDIEGKLNAIITLLQRR